jgi:hypothetical protein
MIRPSSEAAATTVTSLGMNPASSVRQSDGRGVRSQVEFPQLGTTSALFMFLRLRHQFGAASRRNPAAVSD